MRDWLDALPAEDRNELERTWRLTAVASEPSPSTEAVKNSLLRVQQRLQQQSEACRPLREGDSEGPQRLDRSARRRSRLSRVGLGVAAAVTAVLLFALGYALIPATATAPRGETVTATLPDGTIVELNSASSIAYRRGFLWGDRHVELDGEAYFDVAALERPFVVETFNAQVAVTGTAFNVRARASDVQAATTVVVEEGRVLFSSIARPADRIAIAAGQMSQLDGDAGAPNPARTVERDGRMAWRTGGLFFTNRPVGDILDELERRFDVSIREEPPSMRSKPLTLYRPSADSLASILADVCAFLKLTCEADRDPILLRAPESSDL